MKIHRKPSEKTEIFQFFLNIEIKIGLTLAISEDDLECLEDHLDFHSMIFSI